MSPKLLAYGIAPAALALILPLMHLGVIARRPAWLWIGVFVVMAITSAVVDHLYARNPSRHRLHVRIAQNAAAVTTVIYLTGWGPVLVLAYVFVALENIARGGSRVWKTTALWSLLGIGIGQVLLWQHIAPSRLSTTNADVLALLGAFMLCFVIRMAGAVVDQKEVAERSMRLSEDRFRSLIQNSSDVTIVVDQEGLFSYVSPAIVALLGYEPDEIVGARALDLIHEDDRQGVSDSLMSLFGQSRDAPVVQFRMVRKDGTISNVEAVISDQIDRPSVGGYVANVRDITERKEIEDFLAFHAMHDSLTGLANRHLTIDRAEQMLLRSKRNNSLSALFFIDLDNFKDTNDSLGHEAGDCLLRAVAERFTTIVRSSDTVGRIGGDEFVILTEDPSLSLGPLKIAERIQEALREPFQLEDYGGLPINVTASIGVAIGDRDSAQDLLRDADIALYQAKAVGKDCCVLFEPAMQTAAVDRLELKSALYSALANEQFFILYQPIVELSTQEVRGVEALLRWQHPTRGVISPDEFIPTLEDSGLIIQVGQWVLEQTCAQAARWGRKGYQTTMSVNVSMRQLECDEFLGHVESALAHSKLDPSRLVIEVTESALMHDTSAIIDRLRCLKEIGVMIAIDDFGAGQSSLTYLRQFPVDHLKIDRSFVAAMDGSRESAALIHTLVALGKAMGLMTVAEGIEEYSQLSELRNEDCEYGQGFLFSVPLPPQAMEQLLSRAEVPAVA